MAAFPVTVSRGQQADLPAVRDLGAALLAELRADWGEVIDLSLGGLRALLQQGAVPCVAYDQAQPTVLRGATLFVPDSEGRWEIALVLTDKTLTAARRLSVFWQTAQWGAGQVPAQTVVYGRVKAGGNLDNYLAQRVPHRILTIDGTIAVFWWTAQQILAVAA